jgi:hypothetical protein
VRVDTSGRVCVYWNHARNNGGRNEERGIMVTNEGTPLINVFVDRPNRRNVTVLALPRATAVPMMDYLCDAGFRIGHDGWYSEAEENAQRAAVAV